MDQSARRAALKPVLDESRTYLANLFATTSWSDKPEMLGPIHRPVTLGPDAFQYKIRFLRGLASHPMKGKTARVKYTFFLATPLGGLKERFIAEINNKAAGEAYDQGFIGRYYLPFVPGRPDFDDLKQGLTDLLEGAMYKGKPYGFAFHLVCSEADWDLALIFVEVVSAMEVAGVAM